MNQCQAKILSFGKEYSCYAVNASVLPNGEVWCHQHNPAEVAERLQAKKLAQAVPAILKAAQQLSVALVDALDQAPSVSCPGCGVMHRDYHENTCACDHCASVLRAKEALAQYREVQP